MWRRAFNPWPEMSIVYERSGLNLGAISGCASRSKTDVRIPRRARPIAATSEAGPPPTSAIRGSVVSAAAMGAGRSLSDDHLSPEILILIRASPSRTSSPDSSRTPREPRETSIDRPLLNTAVPCALPSS